MTVDCLTTLHPEIQLIESTLREFGYAKVLNGWIPRNCKGSTKITMIGFEWIIEADTRKTAGFGFRGMVVEMAKMKIQPFEDMEVKP